MPTTQAATAFGVISAVGSSGVYIKNVSVENMMFDQTQQSAESKYVYMNYADGYRITNVTVRNPISYNILLEEVKNGMIVNNNIGNASSITLADDCYGIYMTNQATSFSNIVQGNIVTGIKGDTITMGIGVDDVVSSHSIQVINNKISNVSVASGGVSVGLYEHGKYNTISSNQIVGTTGTVAVGIYIASSISTMCVNNYCYGNGSDTGLANTNKDNFLDEGSDTQWAG